MQGEITGVSLGPGEPELITLKAFRTLDVADAIYCPGVMGKSGQWRSKSLDILRALSLDQAKIHCFEVPMSKDRTRVNDCYDKICLEMAGKAAAGERVSVVAEGDAGFYSSANYLFVKLQAMGQKVKMIAGVPAFIAAGASVGLHIVKQEEKLLVLPGVVDLPELEEYSEAGTVMVIMKLSQCTAVLHEFIRHHPELSFHYFENVGTPDEFYTSSPSCICEKEFPYFSLMIIR